jgi:hypothetical protein
MRPIHSETSRHFPRKRETAAWLSLMTGVLLLGCVQLPSLRSAESPCANFDWYEAGRTDGASGIPISHFKELQARCNGSGAAAETAEILFMNGRDAGLVTYCTLQMGLELGKAGEPYEGVCPSHLESRFLSAYEIGKRIRKLEGDNMELEVRIDSIFRSLEANELQVKSGPEFQKMKSQLDSLKSRRASNKSEINSLEEKYGTNMKF